MTRTSVQDTLKDMLLIMVQKKLINSGRFRFGLYSINRLRERLLSMFHRIKSFGCWILLEELKP